MFLSLNERNILEAKHDCVMQDFDDGIFSEKNEIHTWYCICKQQQFFTQFFRNSFYNYCISFYFYQRQSVILSFKD